MLGRALGTLEDVVHAKRPVRLPVVMTRAEVAAVLGKLAGVEWLMASILYGSGLRLLECVRLRVKDVDFERGQIFVRRGRGPGSWHFRALSPGSIHVQVRVGVSRRRARIRYETVFTALPFAAAPSA